MAYTLEIIGFTIEGSIAAAAAGADRIELCSGAGEGGTTPSDGLMKIARGLISIDIYPMLRPRGGDFLYSPREFEVMKQDLQSFKRSGANGFVVGILLPDGSVDKIRCKELVASAQPLPVCFHRAFDRCSDPAQALEDIIDCGFTRVLTSSCEATALEGAKLLHDLVKQSASRISIMPGSGVNAANIEEIIKSTGVIEIHSSARKNVKSEMAYENHRLNDRNDPLSVDAEEIRAMRKILSNLA